MINVLWKKHPASIVPTVRVLEHYDVVPEFLPLDVTAYTVDTISGRLNGAASPGGIDAACNNGCCASASPASTCVAWSYRSPAGWQTTFCPSIQSPDGTGQVPRDQTDWDWRDLTPATRKMRFKSSQR